MNPRLYVSLLVFMLTACRQEYDSPRYENRPSEEDTDKNQADTNPDEPHNDSSSGNDPATLPLGPDPYEEGKRRLSLGIFYEGGFSDSAQDFGGDANLLIFEQTFTVETKANQNLAAEGLQYASFAYKEGPGWWGGGLLHAPPIDLSSWSALHVSLRSSDNTFSEVKIGLKDVKETQVLLPTARLGYQADGEWHHLRIDLQALASLGLDLTQISFSLLLIGEPEDGRTGDQLEIDNLYIESN